MLEIKLYDMYDVYQVFIYAHVHVSVYIYSVYI